MKGSVKYGISIKVRFFIVTRNVHRFDGYSSESWYGYHKDDIHSVKTREEVYRDWCEEYCDEDIQQREGKINMKTTLKWVSTIIPMIQRFIVYIGFLVIALFIAVGDRD